MRIAHTLLLSIIIFSINIPAFAQRPCAHGPWVKVQGSQLWVDFDHDGEYRPYFIKAVGYQPTPIGRYPSDWGYIPQDPRTQSRTISPASLILLNLTRDQEKTLLNNFFTNGYIDSHGTTTDKFFELPGFINMLLNSGIPAIDFQQEQIYSLLRHDNIFDDPAILDRDFDLMRQMHANTIRIWKGDDTTDVNSGRFPDKLTVNTLRMAGRHHLKVIAGFWIGRGDLSFDSLNNIVNRQDYINRFVTYVNTFKEHKAILFWAIGNEVNYQPMNQAQTQAWYSLVNDMARAAHLAEDPTYITGGKNYHPVAVVNGEVLNIGDSSLGTTDVQMPDLDIWGANVYRGESFGTLFTEYRAKSQKPLWISEFGVDAWHTNALSNPDNGNEDQGTQSVWDSALWDEIVQNYLVTIGGSVMEYSDEWWKPYEFLCGFNSPQCNSAQNHFCDSGSVCQDFGAFPDRAMNQEWFGIMHISLNPNPVGSDIMTPRLVYSTLQSKWRHNPWPDLDIIEFFPDSPAQSYFNHSRFRANKGDPIYFTVTFKNRGHNTAPAEKIAFYVDDHLISKDTVSTLAPGDEITVTSSAAWTASSGKHSIQAIIDADHEVIESDKENNISVKTIIVE